jgi:3-oxosteroid 1-dehydrogenase
MSQWSEEFDFVIIGAGSGGMAAAAVAHDLGLSTLVLEKSPYYGGTSALSGGVIWIPNNHLMAGTGIEDSAQDGLTYLRQVTRGEVDEARLRAYVEQGPAMVEYFERHTQVKFEAADKYCDYYPELPGGKLGSRSLDCKAFSRRKLGKEIRHIYPSRWRGVFNRFTLTAKESHFIMNLNYKSYLFIMWRLFLYYTDIRSRLQGLPDDRATLGQSLVTRLRRTLMDRDIPLRRNTWVEKLIEHNGRIIGVQTLRDGQTQRIKARYGVLMATGGFSKNAAMREQYQASPINGDWTSASDNDQGDGIRLGQGAGADLQFMHCAWWTPAMREPNGDNWALIVGKAMPGSIFVNSAGRRFTNEAAPYEDVVKGQLRSNEELPSIPCYMVFDATYRHKYPIGMLAPSRVQPDEQIPEEYRNCNYLMRGDTLDELAAKLSIDADHLNTTIEAFNRDARQGIDSLFGRGNSASDRYYSDVNNQPNPSLAPIERGPFYGVAIYPGDLGTKGGLKCNEFGQVLNTSGQAISGLYATGNCSGAVMGDSYPGAGATIGSAMTFGYIAARHAAERAAQTQTTEQQEPEQVGLAQY